MTVLLRLHSVLLQRGEGAQVGDVNRLSGFPRHARAGRAVHRCVCPRITSLERSVVERPRFRHGNNRQLFALLGSLSAAALLGRAAVINEDFSTDPSARGWRMFGDNSLFHWNATNQNLQTTWDSSHTNSYFYRPLGDVLSKADDFGFGFDLKLGDIAVGVDPNKPSTFQLAVGFQNFARASATNFWRGTGRHSPNLVEFDFFPDSGFGPTIWPSIWSTNSAPNYNGSSDYTIMDLPVGVVLRVTLNYTASNHTLSTTITTNGVPLGPVYPVKLSPSFTDFRVETFAVESYSDVGQDPMYGGSLLAHGVVDNIALTLPPGPLQNLRGFFSNGQWQVQFTSRTNWSYVLEGTSNFQSWTEILPAKNGTGGALILPDTNRSAAAFQFYRVKAQRLD